MTIPSSKQYPAIVIVQYALLLFDICVNSFSSFAKPNPFYLLTIYVVQDFCLIVALTILLINFFATYIFQDDKFVIPYVYSVPTRPAGLIQLLYVRFCATLVLCVVYIILSISLHTWHITLHWYHPLEHYWTIRFHSLYSTQRTVSVLYYYFYKRASLRIGDPRFYEGSGWMQKQLSIP